MEFKVGSRVEVIDNFGDEESEIGDKGIVQRIWRYQGEDTDLLEIITEDGRKYSMYHYRFKELKEESPMFNIGDRVVAIQSSNGLSIGDKGTVVGFEPDYVCVRLDGAAEDLPWYPCRFKVIPKLTIGSKVTVFDCSYGCELVDGKVVQPVCGEINKGIHEITEMNQMLPASDQTFSDKTLKTNDTIIRRISDGRVFFVQQRFLKEYVAEPKFTVGQIVECDDEYARIAKVNNDETYVITFQPSVYADGSAEIVESEDQLKEVTV